MTRLFIILITLTFSQSSPAASEKPNIVLFLADDLGYGYVGCYGATKVKTPNIDSLAREGMKFTDAHTAAALCCPSCFALMTGTLPWRTGKGVWATARSGLLFDVEQPTLGTVMKAAGYNFLTVLRDDLGLKQLLKSDFVVANDLMADYYGIPGVNGSGYQRVAVPAGLPRGGLLGMAATLAMGSDGERSSPVERGAFVMRRLLHAPPPPAPANVAQLTDAENRGDRVVQRDQGPSRGAFSNQ